MTSTLTMTGSQSMSDPIRRVLVCRPETAGWADEAASGRWRELGYRHAPDAATAARQHAALVDALRAADADVIELAELDASASLSMDAVYAHDASLPTEHGMVLMRMGKPARSQEPARHAACFEARGIPVLGGIESPGTTEAGDMIWLDDTTLLVGRGYRTNADGIRQLGALLGPRGIEVIESPLPHGPGPDCCLHLMSNISVLDERVAVVDLPWLAVQTVELLVARGFELIPIEASERDSLACNVLALGRCRLLAIAENARTNARLAEQGFDVRTFPGSEICHNGSGGPTCLTRPLTRG